MSIHNRTHGINTDNHSGGTTASTGEVNVLGTNDAGAVVEVAVEASGAASTTALIVKRAADGHIAVPQSGQTAGEVLSKQQVEDLIAAGIWKGPVHSVVADHTSAQVGDGTPRGNQTSNPALAVNDIVINTADKKYYTVTSIAGGTTGATCTYGTGVSPTTAEARIDKSSDRQWVYDTDGAVWVDLGSSNHARQHAMTGTSDHSAGNNKMFYSNGSAQVVELALAAANSPLLAGGTTSAPVFGTLLFASAPVTAAGADPVDSDITAWGNNTIGIVVGTGGKVFAAYKNATDCYFVELTAI
jgi:hypothetical protein